MMAEEKIVAGLIIGILGVLTIVVCGSIYVDVIKAQNTKTEIRKVEISLVEKCYPYYNDGTDRWIECMGVGYK